MNYTGKKMTKIIDELVGYFLRVGADDMQVDLKRRENGYQLMFRSNFDPSEREKLEELVRFLKVEEKNEALEEFFWQLAGVSSSGGDSEIHLIGQMVDTAEVKIDDKLAVIMIFKAYDQ